MTTVRSRQDTELMAHLLRRASFGATHAELERALDRGYEATVEELLNPQDCDELPYDLIRRYHVEQSTLRNQTGAKAQWIYRMATTRCPLLEKVTLFWHRVFATAATKLIQARPVANQLDMFRQHGMGSFRDLLFELSRDPAMLMWLDNMDNHRRSINENYGREILELFSMGVGNYTEQDIKECARAFTGWSVVNPDYMTIKMRNNTARPYGYMSWQYQYDADDHDAGVKTFLGETGRFGGGDVVDIICRQEATPRFIARHLYHFFVADDVPVPQWPYTPPEDPEAIELMAEAYFESDYEIKAMLRTMFNSDFFKAEEARFARIKSPSEMVVGALRVAGGLDIPSPECYEAAKICSYMGQDLLNPPSVEGWYGGPDWINTGAYVERVNFASRILGDPERPGVRALIDRIAGSTGGGDIPPERLVDACLEFVGPMPVEEETRQNLIDYAERWREISPRSESEDRHAAIAALLRLIVTTQEYQLV